MNKKIGYGIAAIIVVVLVIVFVNQKSAANVTEQEIKIGLIAPLTGDAASYGEPIQQGAQLALEQLNARADKKYSYTLVAEDGKCSGPDAVSAVNKLINVDHVSYIIAGACSSEVLAIAPITEKNHVLIISPFASNPSISEAGPYTYRTVPSDTQSGEFIGNYLKGTYSKLAILSEQTDFSQALGKQLTSAFSKQGGSIVFDSSFQSTNKDFKTEITKLKNSDADVFFINVQSESNLIAILTQLKNYSVALPQYSFFLTSDAIASNPVASNVIMFDVPGVPNSEAGNAFSSAFLAKYNKAPSYPFGAAGAYDDMHLIVQGIEKNGTSSDNVKSYLDTLGSYDGAVGTFHFDENGDSQGFQYQIKKVDNGKFVELK